MLFHFGRVLRLEIEMNYEMLMMCVKSTKDFIRTEMDEIKMGVHMRDSSDELFPSLAQAQNELEGSLAHPVGSWSNTDHLKSAEDLLSIVWELLKNY